MSYIGADIKAINLDGYLDEVPISEFLVNQQNADGQPVLDFAFVTTSTQNFQNVALDDELSGDSLYTEAESSIKVSTTFYGIPSNLLNVTYNEFYIPDDMQDVNGVDDLPDGKINAVGLLFSDDDIDQYPTYPSDNQDAYDIGRQYKTTYNVGPTQNIKVLLSSGL